MVPKWRRAGQHFGADASGAVALIFSLVAPVLLGAAGTALDYVTWTRQQAHLQTAVDAAALSAARELTITSADQARIDAIARSIVLARLDAAGIDLWVFADSAWNLRDGQAPYTDLERRTLRTEPNVVPDLSPLLARAAKIVGVSRDHAGLARVEEALAAELGGRAAVHCSQPYYLDVTPPGIDKGSFVADLGRQLGIPRQRIATLGDAANDIALFRESGLSIAMGNAAPAVRQAASRVTLGNDEDGFAHAINQFVFGDT